MSTTIRSKSLTKTYGENTVVNRLSLDIAAGEVFGLLGPNGAGKTTTILMLLGLVEPTRGSIEVLGLDPRWNPLEVKRKVGYLPDSVGFYDTMTGRENLAFTARLNGLEDFDDLIDSLLGTVGLTDAADQRAGEYSRGMKQRLGVADALVKGPSVLILDEPTTAIDPEGVVEMLDLIRKLAVEDGVTVLLASHLLHQVQAVCDRVAIFVKGKVVAQGTPHELAAVEQGGRIHVEFRLGGEPSAARAKLEGLGTVSNISPGRIPGSWVGELEAKNLAPSVSGLVSAGADVLGVHRVDEDLETIYRSYFETREEVPA
ncbi:MAG TPA: ABC transporter ATP-binding protein [Acidimicrobiia bacterium]|jgi:ABC-2 type transport system ATP-binding protein